MFCGAAIDYLNSSVKCTAGNFFFSNGYWNEICHVQTCQISHVGGFAGRHTHKEWWADGIHSVSATSPLSALPPGPIQQQMSLAKQVAFVHV